MQHIAHTFWKGGVGRCSNFWRTKFYYFWDALHCALPLPRWRWPLQQLLALKSLSFLGGSTLQQLSAHKILPFLRSVVISLTVTVAWNTDRSKYARRMFFLLVSSATSEICRNSSNWRNHMAMSLSPENLSGLGMYMLGEAVAVISQWTIKSWNGNLVVSK